MASRGRPRLVATVSGKSDHQSPQAEQVTVIFFAAVRIMR